MPFRKHSIGSTAISVHMPQPTGPRPTPCPELPRLSSPWSAWTPAGPWVGSHSMPQPRRSLLDCILVFIWNSRGMSTRLTSMRPVVHQGPRREVHSGPAAHAVVETSLNGALRFICNLQMGVFNLRNIRANACEYPAETPRLTLAGLTSQRIRPNSPMHDGVWKRRVGILDYE